MRQAVVKLLVVMASEVSDPKVMKQDRPETSCSRSRTQPASSPSLKTSKEMTLLNKGKEDKFSPPPDPGTYLETSRHLVQSLTPPGMIVLLHLNLLHLLPYFYHFFSFTCPPVTPPSIPGSFVPLITFFFPSPQVISACLDFLDGILQ